MPRRLTSSAAGALAAALLAATSAPAIAQDGAGQNLRGSINPQDETVSPPPPSRVDKAKEKKKKQDSGLSTSGSTSGGQGGQISTTPGTPGAAAEDATALPSALPAEPPPPLGGLGDEPPEPAPEIPEFGITTHAGEPIFTPPGLEDSLRHRPLPPQRHDLDPYVPIGMKLGSFLLFTEAQIGTILTDNVLGTRLDPQSDIAFEFAPDVRLQSDWSRHFFSASFIADRSWYKDFPEQDDRTYFALLNGRLDVTRRSHLELEVGKSQTQEGRNSISLTDIAGTQTSIQEEHITAGVDHTFNRLTLKLEGTIARYDYEDVTDPLGIFDPTVNTFIPFQDIRDFRQDELKLRGTYEFNPRMAWFVEGAINEYDYRQPISIEGITRGSSGYAALSGMQFALTGKFTGEFSVGWGEQQSIDEAVGPIEGVLLNADLLWQPTPMTLVEFIARSEISETTLVDSLGAIDRYYELSIQQAFWRYLVLGGYVSYEIADYAANPLVDQRLKEGVTAEYYFNPYASVYARYEHTDFFSTDPASDFIENEFRIGMRIRH